MWKSQFSSSQVTGKDGREILTILPTGPEDITCVFEVKSRCEFFQNGISDLNFKSKDYVTQAHRTTKLITEERHIYVVFKKLTKIHDHSKVKQFCTYSINLVSSFNKHCTIILKEC